MITITADIFRCQSLGRPDGKVYFFFLIVMILVLGLTSYNVGLALRQKVMLYPAFILIIAMLGRDVLAQKAPLLKNNSLQSIS